MCPRGGLYHPTPLLCSLVIQSFVCVYYCRTYYKAVRGGGRRRVEDMCYERRRAEACVDESAYHALVNAGGREIVVFYTESGLFDGLVQNPFYGGF